MRALWDNLRFNKPKNKYSLEHLKYLYSIISKNPIINDQNKVIIIETLRQIAELLIWGDQHNSVFFDYFLEKNLLAFFLNILDQKTSKNVKVQLLQTLSILIENIRAQNSLYYLFSNNHVNELIIHRFDFSDEEVLAYYISLLKTLSLKLDRSTIQFFFNAQENDFPLYTEAIKFFNHEEGMIRIAVRTLTLNVYRVEDEAMRKYILNSTAVPYFSNIVWFIRQQCHTLDQMVRTTSHDHRRKLDDFVAEMLDHFYYLHDIFCLGIESMSLVLSEQLLHYLLTPLLVESLGAAVTDKGEQEERQSDDEKISPVLALFLLAQVFTVFTHKPLINTLAAALIHPDPSTFFALKQQCPVGPPPPLSDLVPKRTHYVSFRRFSSVPNLEVLESMSMKGTQSAPPSPVPATTHDTSAVPMQSPHQSSFSESHHESKFISASPSKSSPSLLSLDEPSQDSPPIDESGIPTIQIEDYSSDTSPIEANSPQTPTPQPTSPEKGRNIHRDALLGFFEDDRTALNALCMLNSLVKNEAVDKDLLEIGGLFPYRLTKAKYLLDILTSNNTAKPLQAPAVSHLREEHHHSRSKSDSHTIAVAITDLNLRRKALLSNLGNELTPHPIANTEGTDNETTVTATETSVTDVNDSNPSELSEGHSSTLVHRPYRSSSQVKKPLPSLPLGREDSPKPVASHQHAFTHSLIGRLLNLLVKSNHYRLVTLQLTLIMLKELVCSPDSPPGLTPRQLATFERAYRVVSDILERRLSVEIFLELFDVEVKNYKPPNFEYLIKDAALLLPVSGTSKSRLDLARRLPSGETEITQQAIQQYLVLRELKYTILHKKDDVLPHIKQHIPNITVCPKDQYTIDSTAECIVIPFVTVIQGASVLKKRQKRLLVVNKESIIVLDPTTSTPKPPPKPADLQSSQGQPEEVKSQQPSHNAVTGTVAHAAPLQSINLEIDHNDPLSLHVTSHPTTWSMPMVFEDDKKCQAAYELLMVARNELRDARIFKIRTLLATSEDKTYVSTNTSIPPGTKDESADTLLGGGIDSIIHTVETINKSSKTGSDLAKHQPASYEDYNLTSSGFASALETTDLTEQTEPTDLTEQTEPTERIDLTEEYSDPAVDTDAADGAFSTEFTPSSNPEHPLQASTHIEPTLAEPTLTSIPFEQNPLIEPPHAAPLPTIDSASSELNLTEATPAESIPTQTTTHQETTVAEAMPEQPTPIEPTPSEPTMAEPTSNEPTHTEPTSIEIITTEPTSNETTETYTLAEPTSPESITSLKSTLLEPSPPESVTQEPESTPTETTLESTPTQPTVAETTLGQPIETSSPFIPPSTNNLSEPFASESPSHNPEPNSTEPPYSLKHTPVESSTTTTELRPPTPTEHVHPEPDAYSPNGKHVGSNGHPNYVYHEDLPETTHQHTSNNLKFLHSPDPSPSPLAVTLHDTNGDHHLPNDIPIDVSLTPPPSDHPPNGITPHHH